MFHIRKWVCLFVLCTAVPMAQAVPDSYVVSDDSVGPTCAHYLGMGRLAWSKAGGDWADEAGTLYGSKAFDASMVALGRGRPYTEWNVTKLVNGWLEGRFPNAGMLLRVVPGGQGGVVDFHSRESADSLAFPVLKLKWADGTQTRLKVAADTFLDCTSITSLGARGDLKVGASQSALLRFDLPKPVVALESATLYLVSDVQYGNGAKIGVYRVAPPFARPTVAASVGIAKGYLHDVGIETNPDVIFSTGFDSRNWQSEWSEKALQSNAETVDSDNANQFSPLVGSALRVRLVKGSNYGLDLRYNFASQGKAEPEEIYFRYYLRFGDDWNPSRDGGKLPGIAGTYGRAGWGMRRSDGFNGWSLRGGFAARPSGAKSVVGLTSLVSYVYHADIRDSSGEIWGWGEGPAGLLQNNRWYAVEQYVKLNDPGVSNGVVRAWVDGAQVMERTNVRFRHTPALKIETIWLDVYHGGTAVTPENMSLYIDNVVVARRYIGPMKSSP